jgi:glutathione S-transferase
MARESNRSPGGGDLSIREVVTRSERIREPSCRRRSRTLRVLSMTAPVIVRGLPPVWGAPSPSPFAIKLLTWLRMADIEHELVALRSPPRSRTRKVPYVELPGGEIVADSSHIIVRLSSDHGVDLDAGLDDMQRSHARMLECVLEHHLYFVALYERYATPGGARELRPRADSRRVPRAHA